MSSRISPRTTSRGAVRADMRCLGAACAFVAMLLVIVFACLPAVLGGAVDQVSTAAECLTLVVPTYFASADEPRFKLTLQSLTHAARAQVLTVVVDASADSIRSQLRETGAHVVKQGNPAGKKGAALREGLQLALDMRGSSCQPVDPTQLATRISPGSRARDARHSNGHVIGFFEPEKLGMVVWMLKAARYLRTQDFDIVIPRRDLTHFSATYPKEQYHQEMFTNLFIDSIATQRGFPRGLDWTFGPVLLNARFAPLWLKYHGSLWDAQVVPYLRAVRWYGARIGSIVVPYEHPVQMRVEEEGKAQWAHKRYQQLALWVSVLPKELSAETNPELHERE